MTEIPETGTTKSPYRIRGIDTPDHLMRFFEAKGHRNLVLRIVDVIELRNEHQQWLYYQVAAQRMLTIEGTPIEGFKSWFLRQFPQGYIVLPFKGWIPYLSMDQLKTLQDICMSYMGIRFEKGWPSVSDVCAACRGSGKQADGRKCETCMGLGKIYTYIEMSAEEVAMAVGDDA